MSREFNDKPYSDDANVHLSLRDNGVLHVELTYPNLEQKMIKAIVFNQESVRASDGIRISYDYDRDGYKIEQASRFSWAADDSECDPDWQEVAFIQAWARDETVEDTKEGGDGR